ncbi:MAG: AbrB/MazE/SpoVT family DNA-binding domain-containing protein [Candidatus Bathyarchaeota archaeon]|nr:AbrB/MazE/SpoVT family DNA-binding domain-containing protein [Candidatus Bathyarchaeota archaeon]
MQEEVKVTRKYQVTIPESVRSELGVKIGDKLIVKSENKKIIMETPKHITNPSDTLWCLFGEPIDVDAVKLVEESWETSLPPAEPKKLHGSKQRKTKA